MYKRQVFLHLIAQAGLEDRFVVDSAGTGGWHVGNPADRRMRAAAERRGIHLPSRARQIELAEFSNFDRILTMDDDNLLAVRSLAGELGARSDLALVEPMTSHCRRFGDKEVPDPYYGGEQGFEHVLELITDGMDIDAVIQRLVDLFRERVPHDAWPDPN